MEYFIIILLMIIAYLLAAQKINNIKNASTPSAPKNTSIQELPYRRKFLLTKSEYYFYKQLKNKCDELNYLICPKVRLEDIAEVTTKQNANKYRGYIKSRHVDFIICDSNLAPIAAIELDDYSHNTKAAKRTDEFKNNLFNKIGLPLHRIHVKNNYENELNNIFGIGYTNI